MNNNIKAVWFACIFLISLLIIGCGTYFKIPIGEERNQNKRMYHRFLRDGLNSLEISPISLNEDLSKESNADNIREKTYNYLRDALRENGYQVVNSKYVLPGDNIDGRVVLHVDRYRERSGSAAASGFPASVHLQLTLYSKQAGRKIWSDMFNRTQEPIMSNIARAMEYPGGGSRWLMVEELSAWGIEKLSEALRDDYPPKPTK